MIDAGNSVPLYLAASYYGAKQLQQTCEYWMGVNYADSEKNAQWKEVPVDVRERAKRQHELLLARREEMLKRRVMKQNVQCLFAPEISKIFPP